MSTVPTQIRIDRDIKEQAGILFSGLGLDMSGAVNMFLHQCVLRGGIPFSVEIPHYKQSTLAAMEDARRISRDPNVPSYDNMDELKRALEE
ncbi:type II toxin-antitoxin system RelB/DinJ family antitoxin [uncultured Selenomonas sp.]|uniref:type II toxin-antitoxin system RelB/DinJ family antitoxin n=1 Tax=uncultured Selenomonas sp. TaxID=159275 RepID=UPI0028D5FC1F|nr:type II toxin-antitoxin system RelB/DinJ family antitoxin [uncultured Selenomonas sp.]